jgi:hypothetical protein
MPILNPSLPPTFVNKWADGTPNRPPPQFPRNLVAPSQDPNLPPLSQETQQQILLWVSSRYLWPQIQERLPFERMWASLLEMSRVTLTNDELFSNTQQEDSRTKNAADESNRDKARCTDTSIHDAIERLTNITRFIAFKDDLPIHFKIPDYMEQPMASKEYNPLQEKVKAGNAILSWNSTSATNLKRQSTIAYRHHYTYGIAFIHSDFQFKVENITRRDNQGQFIPNPELTKFGTSFDPISINKLWLNWRLPAYDMEKQPCPFFFQETPRFAILQNTYDPVLNPFGYANLENIKQDNWLYNEQAFQAARTALNITFGMMENSAPANAGMLAQMLQPKHSVEAKWTVYPMLPLDPTTGQFDFDGKAGIPYTRFVMEMFGPNIHSGGQVILRLQQNYYPKNQLPLYASVHMPDLDSGAYAPSIGQLLYSHFKEITLCKEQYFNNKDWINDPPAWVQSSSPALNMDLTKKGAKITVNGPNDFGWRTPYDATGSTVLLMRMLKEESQTTSKAVDAILGKAMGSRTSATEANNVYQAAMSGVTADIDSVTEDLHGAYAQRVWDYTGLWADPDLLKAITGQLGFTLTPQDMWVNLYISTDCGSQFVSKSLRQQNLRYILESSKMETILDRQALWTELLEDMNFNAKLIVNDGYSQQIQLATMQSCQTYLGQPVFVDPDQDHAVALKVKTSFIKDTDSPWNQQYPQAIPLLIQQIEQHQLFLQLFLQQQMLQQQMAMAAQQNPALSFQTPPPMQQTSTMPPAMNGGQMAQQQGGAQ